MFLLTSFFGILARGEQLSLPPELKRSFANGSWGEELVNQHFPVVLARTHFWSAKPTLWAGLTFDRIAFPLTGKGKWWALSAVLP